MLTLVYFVYFLVLEEAVQWLYLRVRKVKPRNMPNCTEGVIAIIINRA